MGRAIVREPQVFLMDEPLSNLDAKLRVATRAEVATLQRNLGVTTLYVTHDQVEAMTMGDRVAVMKGGVLQQCDTPRALYDRPANSFVAGFMGSPPMNLLEGTVTENGVSIGSATMVIPHVPRPQGATVVVGLRPESVALSAPGTGVRALVTLVEQLGAEAYVHAQLGDESSGSITARNTVIARTGSNDAPDKGAVVDIVAQPGSILFFDSVSGDRID
jgi:multiple sugar transport system ATP-binding protein